MKAVWGFGAALEDRNKQSRVQNAGRSRYVVLLKYTVIHSHYNCRF